MPASAQNDPTYHQPAFQRKRMPVFPLLFDIFWSISPSLIAPEWLSPRHLSIWHLSLLPVWHLWHLSVWHHPLRHHPLLHLPVICLRFRHLFLAHLSISRTFLRKVIWPASSTDDCLSPFPRFLVFLSYFYQTSFRRIWSVHSCYRCLSPGGHGVGGRMGWVP